MLDKSTVYVVEDDPQMRESLGFMIDSVGPSVEAYDSAEEFLDHYADASNAPHCLILDVRLPGMSGLGLQEKLTALGIDIPTIILTAHGDVPMTVQAMRAGAVDFLEKPIHRQILLDRIQQALDRDAQNRYERKRQADVKTRLTQLSTREQQTLDLLVAGKNTKEIAATLGIGVQTVAKHRAAILEKMGVRSVVELVHLISSVK